jgi:hypothetical protein
MIPKKIHYCWFGGKPLPLQAKRCLASWAYRMPDYELIRWDESNFDPRSHSFTAAAYMAGYFAFVSDYARMLALSREGGIYLDTDVEVLAALDGLLESDFFIGLEAPQRFATCVIGARAGHWLTKQMLAYYDQMPFDRNTVKELVNVNEVSRKLMARGFSGHGGDEQQDNERVLKIGMLATVSDNNDVRKPLTRHWYAASWHKRDGKSVASRVWRKIRKFPAIAEVWCSLQMYRLKNNFFLL